MWSASTKTFWPSSALIIRGKFSVSIGLMFATSLAHATNKVGNGGNSVVCKTTGSENSSTAQLLDFYEVDLKRDFDKSLDEYALAKSIFEKLQKLAPELGAQYLRRLTTLKDQIEFKDGVILSDTNGLNLLCLRE